MNITENLATALRELIAHEEALNHAFYVEGKASAMRPVMAQQKALLAKARATLELLEPAGA